MIKSACEECNCSTVLMYGEEHAPLLKHAEFKCRHGISKGTSLFTQCGKLQKEVAVPLPGITHVSLAKRFILKILQSKENRTLTMARMKASASETAENKIKIS